MDNLWQRLKPAVKKEIMAGKDEYPFTFNNVKNQLTHHKFWSDLSMDSARQVISFTHHHITDLSVNDILWGNKFITEKND